MTDTPATTGRIAIVGLAGRFPGARSANELWRLIAAGREATTWVDDQALLAAGARPDDIARPDYVKATMILPDMEMFDAGFFGFSPREAQILDPQHRHFIETCWEALEDAGHVPRNFAGAIGVFGGCGMQAYMAENLMPNARLRDSVGMFLLRHTGNDKDFLTTRVSYLFDLKGPSIGVQTACSTSLVAIHMACQSLMAGECDMALAGGVSIELPHGLGYIAAEGEILSPTGRCAAFDDDAKGTIFGSGAAVVVLRRLEDALADGDNIRAVILGTAVNNDGASKAGYLAPSVEGQTRAAEEAVAIAGVEPSTVDYIEAHGTGTVIGDPIELEALAATYGAGTSPGAIGIGSIKTNIGHLDTAAGAASLIKVVLGLEHERLPPSLNFRKPNSRFAFADSPFRVVAEPRHWTRSHRPRRAAINSLGVGGTNAHAVIEEAPSIAAAAIAVDHPHLFTLSAKTPEALDRLVAKWQAFLAEAERPLDLAAAAFTTQVGRQAFERRLAVVARSREELAASLAGKRQRRLVRSVAARGTPSVVFMFPGGGAQYPGAGRGLYRENAVFRAAADACLAHVPAKARDLGSLLFGDAADAPDAATRLEHPLLSILAVFTVSYALARTWQSLGVEPSAVIGHSAGDYAAAVVAGVMSLEDAIDLVALRGEIFAEMPAGAMLSVSLGEDVLRARAGDDLDIAVVNGPELCVASGDVPAIDRLAAGLDRDGIDNARVRIGVAAHARGLDPFLARFRARLTSIRLSPPRLPMISGLTGSWASPEDVAKPEHWVRHLRETVRFGDGLATVLADLDRVLLEVGPGRGLGALARLIETGKPAVAVVASTRSAIEPDDDASVLTLAAGHLWAAGVAIDLANLRAPGTPRRVSLPTYAFERQRHWIDAVRREASPAVDMPSMKDGSAQVSDAIVRLPRRNDWYLTTVMRPKPLPQVATTTGKRALVLADATSLGAEIAEEMRRREVAASLVVPAASLSLEGGGPLGIDRDRPEHYEALLTALEARGERPDVLVFVSAPDAKANGSDAARKFDRLLSLVKAVARAGFDHVMRLAVVTTGAAAVGAERVTAPSEAILLGPVRVWPHETPGASAVLIDMPSADRSGTASLAALADEILTATPSTLVALRREGRFVEAVEPLPPTSSDAESRIKSGGVYLVTGGLGGIGTLLARDLVERHAAKVALVGRRAEADLDRAARQVLAELGDNAVWLRADVTDAPAMARAIEETRQRFGGLDGVFHAAGTMDDAPLAVKTRDEAQAVLAAKVDGGRILDRLLPPWSIGLFAVFSSTSAVLGPPGQIDYVAANAYLDALASSRPDGLAIDWGIWRDTGLALRSARRTTSGPVCAAGSEPARYPLLGHETAREPGRVRFEARFEAPRIWALAEHVVGPAPVLPGTAYLEIAALALGTVNAGQTWTLERITIDAPMAVAFGTSRHVTTEVILTGASAATIEIASVGDGSGPRIVHFRASARGTLSRPHLAAAPVATDGMRELPATDYVAQAGAVDFGPRWNCLADVRVGAGVVRARAELPARFAHDLEQHPWHPALADMAMTIGLHLVPASDRIAHLFVPAALARLTFLEPLPASFIATAHRVRYEPGVVAAFDVRLEATDGRVLVAAEGLEMRAIPREALADLVADDGGHGAILPRLLSAGLRASEAPELLERVLRGDHARVIVSSIALDRLQRLYDELASPPRKSAAATGTTAAGEPMTGTEREIAAIFGDLLGLDRVGPDDEFLALGGHSLAAVRLFARIRRQLGADLGMATLFEAPSVRKLAAIVDEVTGRASEDPTPDPIEKPKPATAQARTSDSAHHTATVASAPRPRQRAWSPLVRIAAGEPGRPPLFWIHGAMGNVVSIKPLADLLPSKHPIYGIQAQGVDGRLPPLEKVEDMAVKYVAAIREIDPEGPYCLLGYSGGGVIGYEMSRQLSATGQRVAMLAMIDSLAPSHAVHTRPMDWIRYGWTHGWSGLTEQVRLGVNDRMSRLKRWFQKAPAVGTDAPDALIINSGRAFDAYVRAQGRYYMQPYGGSIVLFRAARSGIAFMLAGHTLGWSEHVGNRVEVVELDADHETIITNPHVDTIARIIDERLDAAWRERNGEKCGTISCEGKDSPNRGEPTSRQTPGELQAAK